MNSRFNGKRPPPGVPAETSTDPASSGERRRLGRVVHDDRGGASIEWNDAPDDYDRPVLELEDTRLPRGKLVLRNDDSFNPYERTPDSTGVTKKPGGKRDLKKLSEWLKLMREMEERKKKGDE